MAFNVNSFRQNMLGDGARPNLFEVQLKLNSELRGIVPGADTAAQQMTFMCKAAQIPGSTLGVVNVPYFGREVKFAGNRTFADWTVTVINDENFRIRNFFESYMNAINTHGSNIRLLQTPSSYVTSATVFQYAKNGTTLAAYDFFDMFPTDLSAIDLDWGSNDAIEEFTVNFTYSYWTRATVTDQGLTAFNVPNNALNGLAGNAAIPNNQA